MASPCSDNCDNSCEALNGLYEKAVNLIAYSDLIKAWTNGPKNGTVNIAGTNVPTLLNIASTLKSNSDSLIATLQNRINNLPSSIVQQGGGLSLDSNGKLVINFDDMPTDKFEAMLKSIRVPIWLSSNMHLYVANNGLDSTTDPTRGFSAAKPFKSIQYAVNFIDDNYNLSRFNAYIHLAEGTYELSNTIRLGSYSTNTGSIIIEGAPLDTNHKPTSWIKTTNLAAFLLSNSVNYQLSNIGYIFNITDAINNYTYFMASTAGSLSLNGFCFEINISNWAQETPYKDIRFLYFGENGVLTLSNYGDMACKINITGNPSSISANTISSILSGFQGGQLNIAGANTEAYSTIECVGNVNLFALAAGASISTNPAYGVRLLKFNGQNFTGKRYAAQKNGRISLSGASSSTYFPGNIAGTADANTYSYCV